MSYILDALRKADAERERDPARGIHARPVAIAQERRARHLPGWAWPASALVIAAGAGAFLWLREQPAAAPPAVAAAMPAPGLVLREPAAPAVMPVAATVMPPAPPMPQRPALDKPAIVAKAAPAAAVTAKAAAVAAPAASAASAAAAATAAVPAAPAASAADRVYAVAELPAEVQRELPKLAISGGVYSENAAQRMLIVGGQVMNEGAQLAPGVVLDQIRARTAVLRYRSWRYSVSY